MTLPPPKRKNGSLALKEYSLYPGRGYLGLKITLPISFSHVRIQGVLLSRCAYTITFRKPYIFIILPVCCRPLPQGSTLSPSFLLTGTLLPLGERGTLPNDDPPSPPRKNQVGLRSRGDVHPHPHPHLSHKLPDILASN